MDSSSSSSSPSDQLGVYPIATSPLPVDLFIFKKRLNHKLKFTDSSGTLIFRVDHQKHSSNDRFLLNSNGTPLFFLHHTHGGGWGGFKGESKEDLIFKVEKINDDQFRRRREMEVLLVDDDKNCNLGEDSKSNLIRARGCPFQRSCTIYRGNSIIAQTSLFYKLRTAIVGRRKFRLTLFPGNGLDQALIVSLVVIFLDS